MVRSTFYHRLIFYKKEKKHFEYECLKWKNKNDELNKTEGVCCLILIYLTCIEITISGS